MTQPQELETFEETEIGRRFKSSLDIPEILKDNRYYIFINTTEPRYQTQLKERIYEPANQAVRLHYDGNYIASILVCAAVGEMLSFLIYFMYSEAYEPPTEGPFNSKSYHLPRLAELKKIGSAELLCDIDRISEHLCKINDTRIKYSHHWELFSDPKMDSETAFTNLFLALGHIFEIDLGEEPGYFRMKGRALGWIARKSSHQTSGE